MTQITKTSLGGGTIGSDVSKFVKHGNPALHPSWIPVVIRVI